MEIPNWLLKQASLNPNRVAVNDGTTAYTFAQLVPLVAPPTVLARFKRRRTSPGLG